MDSFDWLPAAFVCLILPVLAKWLLDFWHDWRTLPPGPWGLPLVGYVPWLGKAPHRTLFQLGKVYGDIFSLKLGTQTVVVLHSWEAIKATIVAQPKIFSGRPDLATVRHVSGNQDVAFNDGPTWPHQRKLILKSLRNVGMGKAVLEDDCAKLAGKIVKKLSLYNNKEITVTDLLFINPLLKVNWKIMSSWVVDKNELKMLENFLRVIMLSLNADNPLNVFPWLRFVPPDGFGFWQHVKSNKVIFGHLRKLVHEHMDKWAEGQEADFIDHYIREIKNYEAENKTTAPPPYDANYLAFTLWNMLIGGIDTTTATSQWGFMYLASNPQIQLQAQLEIDSLVGRSRLPNLEDFAQLPLTEAIIMETHRMATILPFSLPHRARKDAYVLGFKIPKNTTVLQNVYAVHNDPTLWDKPEIFNPRRFLDENNKLKCPPYLIPFSVGPRVCLGKSLADMELRFIFSYVLHQFTISVPENRQLNFEPIIGLNIKPHPYSLLVQKRP